MTSNEKNVSTTEVKNKDLETLESSVLNIRINLKSIVRGFYNVGQTLSELQKNELYKIKGFKNFYDFTFSAFQLSKTQTSNLINVYNRFPPISKYENFSFSQLTEMLSLPECALVSIQPGMTVKEIREIKKKSKSSDVGTKKDEGETIKKKDKIDFGKQVDIVDIVPDDEKEEFTKVVDEISNLEAANTILKNRKESLESKNDNLKNIIREKDESIGGLVKEISLLKEQIERIKSASQRERERDNEKINKLENDNANLCNMIADLQHQSKIQMQENKTLKALNEQLNKSLNEKQKAAPKVRKKSDKLKEEPKEKSKTTSPLNNITK